MSGTWEFKKGDHVVHAPGDVRYGTARKVGLGYGVVAQDAQLWERQVLVAFEDRTTSIDREDLRHVD